MQSPVSDSLNMDEEACTSHGALVQEGPRRGREVVQDRVGDLEGSGTLLNLKASDLTLGGGSCSGWMWAQLWNVCFY